MRLRVITAHSPDPGDVMSVAGGDRLGFERRPTPYRGWIWCTTPGGASAWVPEAWVSIEGDTCIMRRDYVSRELEIFEGDAVTSLITESGWAWVRNDRGEEGWVPLECLEDTEE